MRNTATYIEEEVEEEVEMAVFRHCNEFDICEGLSASTASQRSGLRFFNHLQDTDSAETIDDSRPPADSRAMSNGVLMPDVNSGDNSELTFAQSFGDHAMQQLLERESTDVDALLTIFPKAGLQNNCIRTSHYRSVLRRLLCSWFLSNCHDNKWLSCDELSCPYAYACMFRRLRAELKFVRSEDGSDSKNWSDPRRFYPCLSDLAFDMDKASALVEPKDGEVHVFKETKPYEECLLSVAQVLENRKG